MFFSGLSGIVNKHSMTTMFHPSNPEYDTVADVAHVPNLLTSTSVFLIILGAFIMAFALIGFIGASLMWSVLLLVVSLCLYFLLN